VKNIDHPNRLSGFEWFALSTGLIGLVADFITIASLVHLGGGSGYVTPTAIWVVTPILIIYTTIVLSLYSRRIFYLRHKAENHQYTLNVYSEINRGGFAIAQVIGLPLFLIYDVSLILSFGNPDKITENIVLLLIFGTALTMFFVFILGLIAEILFNSFYPNYIVH